MKFLFDYTQNYIILGMHLKHVTTWKVLHYPVLVFCVCFCFVFSEIYMFSSLFPKIFFPAWKVSLSPPRTVSPDPCRVSRNAQCHHCRAGELRLGRVNSWWHKWRVNFLPIFFCSHILSSTTVSGHAENLRNVFKLL